MGWIEDISSGANSITNLVGTTTNSIDEVSDTVGNFQLPTLNTEVTTSKNTLVATLFIMLSGWFLFVRPFTNKKYK